MLASDLMNPLFVNPQDPDKRLQVEFYWNTVKTMFGKEVVDKETGKPQKVIYVSIAVPGDDTTLIKTPARDDHKRRFPQAWLHFQMKEGLTDETSDIPGWKIDEWEELNEEQRRDLRYQRYSTVEQIAGASDSQVQRLGMDGFSLRMKAKSALQKRWNSAVKDEVEAREAEIAQLKADAQKRDAAMDQLKEQMAQLMSVVKPEIKPVEVSVPKKRGRPKKVETQPEA